MSPHFASILFWVATGLILLAQVAMLRGLRTTQAARRPAHARPRHGSRADILWTLLPALLLALVLALTWQALPT